MSTTITDTRPMLPNTPEGMVDLPAHEFNAEGVCKYCRYDRAHSIGYGDYDEYVDEFWANIYEGERGHRPMERDLFEWIENSCG